MESGELKFPLAKLLQEVSTSFPSSALEPHGREQETEIDSLSAYILGSRSQGTGAPFGAAQILEEIAVALNRLLGRPPDRETLVGDLEALRRGFFILERFAHLGASTVAVQCVHNVLVHAIFRDQERCVIPAVHLAMTIVRKNTEWIEGNADVLRSLIEIERLMEAQPRLRRIKGALPLMSGTTRCVAVQSILDGARIWHRKRDGRSAQCAQAAMQAAGQQLLMVLGNQWIRRESGALGKTIGDSRYAFLAMLSLAALPASAGSRQVVTRRLCDLIIHAGRKQLAPTSKKKVAAVRALLVQLMPGIDSCGAASLWTIDMAVQDEDRITRQWMQPFGGLQLSQELLECDGKSRRLSASSDPWSKLGVFNDAPSVTWKDLIRDKMKPCSVARANGLVSVACIPLSDSKAVIGIVNLYFTVPLERVAGATLLRNYGLDWLRTAFEYACELDGHKAGKIRHTPLGRLGVGYAVQHALQHEAEC